MHNTTHFLFLFSSQDLNQENYRLKLRLDAVTAEYQLARNELQSDIDNLKLEFADERKRVLSRERADRESIDELTRQNEKLTEQLFNVSINNLVLISFHCTAIAVVIFR